MLGLNFVTSDVNTQVFAWESMLSTVNILEKAPEPSLLFLAVLNWLWLLHTHIRTQWMCIVIKQVQNVKEDLIVGVYAL